MSDVHAPRTRCLRWTSQLDRITRTDARPNGRPLAHVAAEIGVGEQVPGRWVRLQRQAAAPGDTGAVLDADECAELERLRRENKELLLDGQFVKKPRPSSFPNTTGRSLQVDRGGEGHLHDQADERAAGGVALGVLQVAQIPRQWTDPGPAAPRRVGDLVEAALAMAVAMRGEPAEQVILHADRGCQHTSAQLARFARPLVRSVGRTAAGQRSGRTILGNMEVEFDDRSLWPKAAAKLAIGDWVERVYNRRRGRSAIAMMSPVDFEDRFPHTVQAA